ncbi:PKD domain-containing protein [Candidatus Pacearchaeota archaeon]|nr:PKD domain-containing protein [Candidatus Pacearchaeota archaeon]
MVTKKGSKKVGLSLIIFSIILMTAMVVYAAISGVNFITPVTNDQISDTHDIQWNNNESNLNMGLQYRVDNCNDTGTWNNISNDIGSSTSGSYLWNTSGLSGDYCLRIYDNVANKEYSGIFTIDNVDPTADFANEPYTCTEGGWVIINASTSSDPETSIANYAWDTDGDGFDDGSGTPDFLNYTCGNGDNVTTVSVQVTDEAGNTNTGNTTVNISNVAPVCIGITTSINNAVEGQDVTFTENATDIIDSLTYSWDFNDSNSSTGNPVTHSYDTAGTYTVGVNVSDGD